MKNALILVALITFFSCSSSDDNDESSIDTSLLYGQWYKVGLCQEQNSLLLNSNKSYISFHSGALDCNDPEPDTYKYTGTFELDGNYIVYTQLTSELVVDGTNLTEQEFPDPNIKHLITILSESTLKIKTVRDIGVNVMEILWTDQYEK